MSVNNNSSASTNGIGFFGLLTIVLVVLKLIGYFPYSWWIVFSPLMVGFGLGIFFLVIVLLIAIFWGNKFV